MATDRVTIVLASTCGLAVANIYYAQPLLAEIARAFHTTQGAAAVVVTVTQLGYALGLVLLLPLGDLLENRALASRTLIVTAVCLAAGAAAPSLGLFLAASVLIGTTSVVAQILIPLAAYLAPAEQRGLYVGRVMSGLLLGILLARALSAFVAAALGWRAIFVISALLMITASLALRWVLPERRPEATLRYRALMRSIVTVARTEPALRRRAVTQALLFGAFSAYWTSVVYELIDAHHLSQVGIGVFALVGAAGAVAAPVAGRLGDRGHGPIASGACLVLGVGALLLAGLGAHHVVLLALAGVALDLATQGHLVLSQQEIYALRPEARARMNTVLMGSVFLGGAAASAASGGLYETHGWSAVTVFAAVLPAIGLVLWATSRPGVFSVRAT